jgi:carboxylate-amine ligase
VAGVAHALVAWLAERHDAGETAGRVPTWRIEENRWSACRYGVEGSYADVRTGTISTTRAHLERLLEEIGPAAERVGATSALVRARQLMEAGGFARQREIAAEGGLPALAAWLADAFGEPL